MTIGEIFIFLFVAVVFALGIYGGIKLFKINQKDRERLRQKNEAARQKQNTKTQ